MMQSAPNRRGINYIATPTPCPQCTAQGGLFITAKLMAEVLRDGGLVAAWTPILCCDGCDLYAPGQFTPSGNTAVFTNFGGDDGPAQVEAAAEAPVDRLRVPLGT